MTWNTLQKGLKEGKLEVAAWSGKGSSNSQWAQVRTCNVKGVSTTRMVEVTKVPAEAERLA